MNIPHIITRVKSAFLYSLRLDRRLRHWDDATYLKLRYWTRMGKLLDLTNPQTFSEKLQWLKIYDRRPEYTRMVDKYDVKEWVTERIGDSYVVPNLGLWDKFEDIDFDSLPEQFVLKCTHDSGGLVICDDRSTFDMEAARAKIEKSLSRNYFYVGREWPYKNVQPRILAEVFIPSWIPDGSKFDMDDGEAPAKLDDGVIDYKFYCFNGEPAFLYVSQGLHHHGTAKMDFLTLDWELTDFRRPDYRRFAEIPPKPSNLNRMIKKARELSHGIPFVRVDFFEHCEQTLFSEMTFSPVSGFMTVSPKTADTEIGQMLQLPRRESRDKRGSQ